MYVHAKFNTRNINFHAILYTIVYISVNNKYLKMNVLRYFNSKYTDSPVGEKSIEYKSKFKCTDEIKCANLLTNVVQLCRSEHWDKLYDKSQFAFVKKRNKTRHVTQISPLPSTIL